MRKFLLTKAGRAFLRAAFRSVLYNESLFGHVSGATRMKNSADNFAAGFSDGSAFLLNHRGSGIFSLKIFDKNDNQNAIGWIV